MPNWNDQITSQIQIGSETCVGNGTSWKEVRDYRSPGDSDRPIAFSNERHAEMTKTWLDWLQDRSPASLDPDWSRLIFSHLPIFFTHLFQTLNRFFNYEKWSLPTDCTERRNNILLYLCVVQWITINVTTRKVTPSINLYLRWCRVPTYLKIIINIIFITYQPYLP